VWGYRVCSGESILNPALLTSWTVPEQRAAVEAANDEVAARMDEMRRQYAGIDQDDSIS
jgi:hypothetical protein